MRDGRIPWRACVGELIGTFILVFFGCGVVHAAVLTGAQAGLWQVAVVWALGIALAIYAVAAISGAHLNPAVTLGFVAYRGFPMRRVPLYVMSQVVGAFAAAATLYALFGGVLHQFEASNGLVRGAAGSELSAMVYGEYFPNPAVASGQKWSAAAVGTGQAMLAEGIGTALLMLFILALTEPRNAEAPGKATPVMIGLGVAIIISVVAPLTQAGLNPARDFGPRLFAYLAGWGSVAIPGPRGGFFVVYILSPIVGAMAGGGVYQFLVRPGLMAGGEAETANSKEHAMPVRFLSVGGFLGAGKTTLLAEAGRRLRQRGHCVGLITNDQAPDLVDTQWLSRQGLSVQEVAGSCFCCNFNGLLDAAAALEKGSPVDVILAEPVGSCTDLSATILQPMKDKHSDRYQVSPLSVLVDPHRLRELLGGGPSLLHRDAAYIYFKQLEEADEIVISKCDLVTDGERSQLSAMLEQRLPHARHRFISALTGEGVEVWLDAMLASSSAGERITEVDYDVYANGEAVLGWFNASYMVKASRHAAWHQVAGELLDVIRRETQQAASEIGHVKLLMSGSSGQIVGNLTRNGGESVTRGRIADSDTAIEMVLNARVQMSPDELVGIVDRALASAAGRFGVTFDRSRVYSLRPGRPVPTHRYASVVA